MSSQRVMRTLVRFARCAKQLRRAAFAVFALFWTTALTRMHAAAECVTTAMAAAPITLVVMFMRLYCLTLAVVWGPPCWADTVPRAAFASAVL